MTTRVKISDFGVIQKTLAQATVTIYNANDDGTNSGTLSTLYSALTGTASVSNPQTLDANGQLSADVYVETDVIATITGITDKVERSLRKVRQNPSEYSLALTSSNFYYVNSVASAASTAADVVLTNADVVLTNADVVSTNADVVLANNAVTAAQTAQTGAETAETNAIAAVGSVKVSSNDTTAGDLEAKLLVGSGLILSTQNDGANETRTINVATGGIGAAELDTSVNVIGSIGGGTQDIDLDSGRSVSGTVDTSTTTFTFSNPLITGNEDGFVLYLANGGSQTITWPASVDWVGGTAPTLTTAGVDVLVFSTIDGGTIWNGFIAGLDVS